MQLDYNPSNKMFILTLDRRRDTLDAQTAMNEYGLELSLSASTAAKAVLFTPQPYAAATFAGAATPGARAELAWIVREIEKSRAATSQSHYAVPRALRDAGTDLWPFQKADLDYMLPRERVLDADEPGLGKTGTSIVYANEIEAQRVLCIVPASIRLQWLRRIVEWSTMGETYDTPNKMAYAVTSGKGGVHPAAAWTVVSYELARTPGILAALRQTKYDLLILDEAHYLKSVGARRTRAVFGGGHDPLYHEALAESATRIIALTGTPLPNRPREAYTLSRHFDHAAIDFLSEERFNARFNPIAVRDVEVRQPSGATITKRITDERSGRHAELQNRLRANFMTRHLKRDVMLDLKYPVFDLVRLGETAAIRAALKAESLLGIDPEHLEGANAEVFGHIAEARRIMGEAMAPQVADYVATLLNGGEAKITLFYWHISVGKMLAERLDRFGVCKVDGSTTPLVKDALIQRFRTDPSYRVMMGNVLSLGTGTDGLQDVCWHAILAEPDWVHGQNQQCFDRLDRGGQRNLVLGDICVVPGSLAEKVLASALRKGHVTFNSLDRRVA